MTSYRQFSESIVEDTALAGLNPDLPAEVLDDPYQVTLAAIRDTLLPKLISGELRVKNVGRLIAGAPA